MAKPEVRGLDPEEVAGKVDAGVLEELCGRGGGGGGGGGVVVVVVEVDQCEGMVDLPQFGEGVCGEGGVVGGVVVVVVGGEGGVPPLGLVLGPALQAD